MAETTAETARHIHDPEALCVCPPGDIAPVTVPICEYRLLADAVGNALNPPDGDEAEVAILITAVERITAYVASLICSCSREAATYDDDPCLRCQAIGQRCGKAEPR